MAAITYRLLHTQTPNITNMFGGHFDISHQIELIVNIAIATTTN